MKKKKIAAAAAAAAAPPEAEEDDAVGADTNIDVLHPAAAVFRDEVLSGSVERSWERN